MSNTKDNKYQPTIDTLTDISVSMIEHHELSDPLCTLNFIDHYRAYVQHIDQDDQQDMPVVNFESFITSQKLLNLAATYVAVESGEQLLTAPKALQTHIQLRSVGVVEKVC